MMLQQPTPARSRRVLLAEDDGALLHGLDHVLTRLGYQVYCAMDEPSASKLLCHASMDVVVADVGTANAPGMDGMALLRKIRGSAIELPVILITGNPTLDTAVQAVDLGAVQYLVKPFDVAALQQAIDKALSQKVTPTSQAVRPSLHAECRPMLRQSDQSVVGFETILCPPRDDAGLSSTRPSEPTYAFGRQVRDHVAAQLCQAPTRNVFVDLGASELRDDTLYATNAPLSRYAKQVIFGIRDTAELHQIDDLASRIDRLRSMGYRILVRGTREMSVMQAAPHKNLTIN